MSECNHKWKYLNTWRKHVCQKCQKPMNVVDFSEYANQLEQERSTALAQVAVLKSEKDELFGQGIKLIQELNKERELCYEHFFRWFALDKNISNVLDGFRDTGNSEVRELCEKIKMAQGENNEATECAKGLVEALEKLACLGGPGGGYGNSDGNVIAQRALAAWRGQEN